MKFRVNQPPVSPLQKPHYWHSNLSNRRTLNSICRVHFWKQKWVSYPYNHIFFQFDSPTIDDSFFSSQPSTGSTGSTSTIRTLSTSSWESTWMAFKASVDGGPKPAHQLYGIISICIFYICINRIYIYIYCWFISWFHDFRNADKIANGGSTTIHQAKCQRKLVLLRGWILFLIHYLIHTSSNLYFEGSYQSKTFLRLSSWEGLMSCLIFFSSTELLPHIWLIYKVLNLLLFFCPESPLSKRRSENLAKGHVFLWLAPAR